MDYSTVDGSGTATDVDYGHCDYTAASGTLIFAPGDTSKTFTVDTDADTDAEDETFLVELSAPESSDPDTPAPAMNARINDGIAVGSILEGDLPELRIADARGDEGSDMVFTVTLSEEATATVTVDYATVQRPQSIWAAVAGDDYTPPGSCSDTRHQDEAACTGATPPATWTPGGTLTFTAGETEMTISVPITDDTDDEVDETFLVELSNPSGASLADPSALGTINGNVTCVANTDPNDDAPVLTVDSPTVNEGDGTMVFTATLERPYCDPARPQLAATPDERRLTFRRLLPQEPFLFGADSVLVPGNLVDVLLGHHRRRPSRRQRDDRHSGNSRPV